MKKMMIAAMMLLASSASFAGNSDVLKAILKAKTYTEAAQLLSQGLNQLADNAEKASAYNHLTQLALKTVQADQAAGKESAEAYEAVGNSFSLMAAANAVIQQYPYVFFHKFNLFVR